MTDYYPFGEIRIDETTTAYKDPYKFTGKELDTESGLYYYEARYYDPAIGRFVSQDVWEGKLDDPQSLNKYSYVRNNPVRYVDPTGKFWEEIGNFLDDVGTAFLETLDVIPVTGDISDGYAQITGKTLFSQESLSQEDLDFNASIVLFPLITGGQTRMIKEIDSLIDTGKKTIKNTKPVVIGETMDRVVEFAKKNGFDYYKSTTKNPENYAKNNKTWINRIMNKGREIIDIGRDPKKIKNNASIGKSYSLEKSQIKKKNYPTTKGKSKGKSK